MTVATRRPPIALVAARRANVCGECGWKIARGAVIGVRRAEPPRCKLCAQLRIVLEAREATA